ncbi:MAG: helix-turn-helix transcriptional regulator [Clostridia bacterium]|nr:helix-turn-helix transcriptional regulator [Clostridia bacterium]
MSLADKLRELRKTKKVSQEKFADYLGVSYQAVSKWENGITSPDITLLPSISRYFGITVDELLQAEKIDERAYFEECSRRSEELFRNGKREEIIPIWLEAYKKMPNNAEVKEMLMSVYFDTDRVKYQKEIIELGTELYNTQNDPMLDSYYQGQAIGQISRTYYENGNVEKAKEWVQRAHSIMHAQEMMYMQIEDNEEWLVGDFRFANHWYLDKLFYMAMRLNQVGVKCNGVDYVQKVNLAVANIFELVFEGDDMGYESLQHLCILHRCIAEDETSLGKDEAIVRRHLTRAVECAVKSVDIKAHILTHPLVYGWQIADAPSDNKQMVRALREEMMWQCYEIYRDQSWFTALISRLDDAE